MISKTQFISSAGSLALLLVGACAPDSSVGPDSVAAGASPIAGAPSVAGAASGLPAAGAPASGGASNAGAPASAGSSTVGGAPASGGASATGGKSNGGAGPVAGAGPVGGAGPGGDSRCAGLTGAIACDGFENAAPGTTGSDWTIDLGVKPTAASGSITVDTTNFYRGKKSIKYSGTTRAYIVNKKIFTGTTKATNNEIWGRYFVLSGVDKYPPGHTVFGTLTDATDSSDPNRFHFAGGSRQKLMAQIRFSGDLYTNKGGKDPNTSAPPFPVPTDSWQCWEFHVSADDSYSFYINNVEVADMRLTKGKADASGSSFVPLPIFGQVQLGWQSFDNSLAATGWIDEVAFGTSRIGCMM